MTTVAEIKLAIQNLNSDQLLELAKWLEELQGEKWDEQIERDVKAGKFDRLKVEIERERAAGRLIDFP